MCLFLISASGNGCRIGEGRVRWNPTAHVHCFLSRVLLPCLRPFVSSKKMVTCPQPGCGCLEFHFPLGLVSCQVLQKSLTYKDLFILDQLTKLPGKLVLKLLYAAIFSKSEVRSLCSLCSTTWKFSAWWEAEYFT